MPRRFLLTPEIEDHIAGYISQGGFDHVAAAAVGVPRRVFLQWMRWGATRSRGKYRRFYDRIFRARAIARLTAEVAVHKDPKFWLCHGPGRERPGSPGWSAYAKAEGPKLARRRARRRGLEWQALWPAVLEALAPYPEARQAIVRALEAAESVPRPGHDGLGLPDAR